MNFLNKVKFHFSTYLVFYSIVLFSICYLLLPTQNSDIDAYNYAANLKWKHDLFFPHHLLYNFFQHFIIQLIKVFGFVPDVLGIMKSINGIFAVSTLFLFNKILLQLKFNNNNIPVLVFMTGSCFGFMRYATENETYIIPIFWSILASYFYLKHINNKRKTYLFISGLFASLACLFHQIHVFWYIGLLLGTIIFYKNYKEAAILLIPSFIIPLVYYWAYLQPHFELTRAKNLFQFVFYDYNYGSANLKFGANNFILGLISFIRSFLQVHGITGLLIQKFQIYYFIIIIFLFFVFNSFRNLLKHKPQKNKVSIFIKIHILIFVLQLVFAIISEGNAEFMVMLPVLLILIINSLYKLNLKIILNLALALFIWNLSFGLIPNNLIEYQNNKQLIKKIENNPTAGFILTESTLVQNIMYYQTGIPWRNKLYKSPALYNMIESSDKELRTIVDSLFSNGNKIFTDCIDEPVLMSRKSYLQGNNNSFFNEYQQLKIDSFETFIGKKYIVELNKK